MLIGVIMAGVDQIIKLDGQVNAVIDTILLITRAVMAVLYSRVIHRLKKDDEPEPPSEEDIEESVTEKVNAAIQGSLSTVRQEIVSQLEATLSQYMNERLTEWERNQVAAMAHVKKAHCTTAPRRTITIRMQERDQALQAMRTRQKEE